MPKVKSKPTIRVVTVPALYAVELGPPNDRSFLLSGSGPSNAIEVHTTIKDATRQMKYFADDDLFENCEVVQIKTT